MSFWTELKSPEQLAAEREEKRMLIEEIERAVQSIPPKVLNGTWQAAVQWKDAAKKGIALARSKSPGLQRLRDAAHALRKWQ